MTELWAGDASSDIRVQLAQAAVLSACGEDAYRPRIPEMLSKQGSVGVLTVKGSLIEGDAGPMQAYGVVGYANIIGRIIEAVSDKDIKHIVVNLESTGGQVAGLTEATAIIQKLKKVKPMSVFTSQALSAGYWLAASIGDITLSDTGTAGSIGTVIVHRNMAKLYSELGSVYVARSGDYKMKPNGYEEIDEQGKETLDNLVAYGNAMFEKAVMNYRGVTAEQLANRSGKGRMLMGTQALDARLVDRIGTLSSTLTKAGAK